MESTTVFGALKRYNAVIPAPELYAHNIFGELLNQTWNLYAVSLLLNLKKDQVSLKKYAKRLREGLANLSSSKNVVYRAKFSFMDDETPLPSSFDSHPLQIQVFARAFEKEDNDYHCIYRGIFLSWGTDIKKPSTLLDSSTLPLLMCSGTKNCITVVHSILVEIFDCTIVTLSINEEDLKWLTLIVLMSMDKENLKLYKSNLHMEYIIPGLDPSNSIDVQFPIANLINMFQERIIRTRIDDTREEISLVPEEIEKFYSILNYQILCVARLQMGLCKLHKINFPALVIADNKIKTTNDQILYFILLYMNKKALTTVYEIYCNNQEK